MARLWLLPLLLVVLLPARGARGVRLRAAMGGFLQWLGWSGFGSSQSAGRWMSAFGGSDEMF